MYLQRHGGRGSSAKESGKASMAMAIAAAAVAMVIAVAMTAAVAMLEAESVMLDGACVCARGGTRVQVLEWVYVWDAGA